MCPINARSLPTKGLSDISNDLSYKGERASRGKSKEDIGSF